MALTGENMRTARNVVYIHAVDITPYLAVSEGNILQEKEAVHLRLSYLGEKNLFFY